MARSLHVWLVAGLAVFVSTVIAVEPAAASQALDEAEPMEIERSHERLAEVAERAEARVTARSSCRPAPSTGSCPAHSLSRC